MGWLSNQDWNKHTILYNAHTTFAGRVRLDRYRSRTETTTEHIVSAFSWNAINMLTQGQQRTRWIIKTVSINRELHTAEELTRTIDEHTHTIERSFETRHSVLILNTSVNKSAIEPMKVYLAERYEAINARVILTINPYHTIYLYKYTTTMGNSTYNRYIILTNMDAPRMYFRLSSVIMKDMLQDVDELAELWATGDCEVVNSYLATKAQAVAAEALQNTLNSEINNITNTIHANRISMLNTTIADETRVIDRLLLDYAQALTRRRTAQEQLVALTMLAQSDTSAELKQFLLNNKNNITYFKINNSKLYIVYKTKLLYYNPTELESYFTSARPNFVNGAKPWKQQLLKDIFLEHKYDLYIESGCVIDTNNVSLSYKEPTALQYPGIERITTGLANPHHRYFNCWGDNKPQILSAITKADYVIALTQVFAAMAGINMSDVPVLRKFIEEELCMYDFVPCLENTESKQIITIQQYSQLWRDAQHENNATNE